MTDHIKRFVNILVILSFIALSWLSVILLMHTHSLMGTGDMPMHLHQLREVQLALQHRTLVYYGLNEFHGSAIMTLYPWLNLWPAALLLDLMKDKVLVIYLYFILNEFLVLLISYFSSLHFSQSKRVSYLFSLFYGLSTLYIDYGFADMDFGELLTMTFLPLVIFGSIALFQRGDWLELSLGMTLIIYSHVLNTLIILGLLIVFFILNLFKLKWKSFFGLIKAVILTSFTTVAAWLPAIKLLYFNPNVTTPPKKVLYGTPFNQILHGAVYGEITYGVSIFALLGVILGAIYFLCLNRYTKQLYVISVIIVVACSAWFPWKLAPQMLTSMQFTWRLYLIPEICLSYVSAKVIVHIIKRFPIINVLMITGLILLSLGVQFESQQKLIDINGKAPVFNENYIHKTNEPYARVGKIIYIKSHILPHHPGTIKTPENYRLEGNQSYNSLFDQKHFLATAGHYFPQAAYWRHFNDINDHWIRSDQGVISHLYSNGYNRFTFNNHRTLTNAFMPIIKYNKEILNVTLDGHKIRDLNHQNVLFIKKIPKGAHELLINPRKGRAYKISCLSLIIGTLLYIICMSVKGFKHIHKRII